MEPSEEMCKSLAKWLQKTVPNKTNTIPEICDGVAMLDALLQISPEHFSKLELKIKKDVGVNNWRLRISNLKKIVEAVIEYYQDVLTLQILDVGIPDVNQIGENNDAVQLAKLLRLILGCAINCDRKQEYITMIMQMEESIQQNIMQAIQQLEEVTGGPGRSGLSLLILDSDTRVMKLVSDLESSNKSREGLIQQVETLEQQVQSLLYEKRILQDQNQALLEKEAKNPQENIRKQLDTLKEELFKSEVRAEDLKSKLLEKEKQMITFQEKINELQVSANESAKLKDEIDALTESAGKVADLELAIVSYKKRLENYQDIRKTLQKLEEKNMEYIQKNMEMEEELAKNNTWKSQCEAYKSQIVELQQKLDEETQRADKAQFNLDKIKSKVISLQGEKERLILERDNLKEEIEELKLGPKESGAAVSEELTQTELEKRLKLVEKENKTLRSSSQEMESKQAQLDSSLNRIEKLQQKNRNLNQTVLKLEAQIEELKMQQTETQGISINSSIVKEYRQKISILQETLASKDNELQSLQTKYNRSVEKAREVAQHLEFKSNGDNTSLAQSNIKELEGRLLTAAFHRLTINSHRESMDERLSVLHGAQGQSFLSRQRTPTPRKPIQRYKSK